MRTEFCKTIIYCQDFGFYSTLDGKPLVGSEQGSDRVLIYHKRISQVACWALALGCQRCNQLDQLEDFLIRPDKRQRFELGITREVSSSQICAVFWKWIQQNLLLFYSKSSSDRLDVRMLPRSLVKQIER